MARSYLPPTLYYTVKSPWLLLRTAYRYPKSTAAALVSLLVLDGVYGPDVVDKVRGKQEPPAFTLLKACAGEICQTNARDIVGAYRLWKKLNPSDQFPERHMLTALLGMAQIESKTCTDPDRTGSSFKGCFQFSLDADTIFQEIRKRVLADLKKTDLIFTVGGKQIPAAQLKDSHFQDIGFFTNKTVQTFAAIAAVKIYATRLKQRGIDGDKLSLEAFSPWVYLQHNLPVAAKTVAEHVDKEGICALPMRRLVLGKHRRYLGTNPHIYGVSGEKRKTYGAFTPRQVLENIRGKMIPAWEAANADPSSGLGFKIAITHPQRPEAPANYGITHAVAREMFRHFTCNS